MKNGLSIKIDYCRYGEAHCQSIVGLEVFQKEIDGEYISVLHKHIIGRGGGVYDFTVELLSNIHLSDVAKLIADGVAFDLLKSSTKSFVLRPFLIAFRKLRAQKQLETDEKVDIGKLKIIFQDAIVLIEKIDEASPIDLLESLLTALSKNYEKFMLPTGGMPYEIHIPVFEDPATDRIIRFREQLCVDETIFEFKTSDYFKFWGLRYSTTPYLESRIYDLDCGLLIDEHFYTDREYWAAWDKKRK